MKQRFLVVISMLLLSIVGAWADYDPQNPPDPYATYLLTVSVFPAESGYASGGGAYEKGKQVSLNTSPRAGFDFQYWTCNGVQISETPNFDYTMIDQPVSMVAVYSFNPDIPDDPFAYNRYHLYLETNMPGSCTFNLISGAKQEAGKYITISAQNISMGYIFQGWYIGDQKVSEDIEFNYLMPLNDITLTATFIYVPDDEPLSTVTAMSYSRLYGEPNPTFEYTSSGATLNGTPEITCEANTTSPVGTYPIMISKGSITNGNISLVNGTLTINKTSLKTSVGEYIITEGDDIPTFTISYEGFRNDETAEVLITAPTVTCAATKESKAGEYEITISGGEAKNYEFGYVKGKLIIKPIEIEEIVEGDDNEDNEDNVDNVDNEDSVATFTITVSNSNNKDKGATYTFTVTSGNNEGSSGEKTQTVTLSNGRSVIGNCVIPEHVTHGNQTFTVTAIAENAFKDNVNVTDVTIPASVESIGNNAFSGCTGLKSITMLNTTPIVFSSSASTRGMRTRGSASSIFDGVDLEKCILYVPEGSVGLYKVAEVWKEFVNILPIASSGIRTVLNTDGKPFDIYDLNGRKIKAKATSKDGLPKGIYIIKNKKIVF